MSLPAERIENTILVIRGHRVMLDADLAERKHGTHDEKFKVVFRAIRELMEPPKKTRRKIGF